MRRSLLQGMLVAASPSFLGNCSYLHLILKKVTYSTPRSIDKELTEIKNQLDRGKFKRAIEATEDQDDVIKRYRKIDSLFRRLLVSIYLST